MTRLLLTAATAIAILAPSTASAQDGNRFVFRAKAGVLFNADFVVPSPEEPDDDDGHFRVVHSLQIPPVSDVLFPGSLLRASVLIVNNTGHAATAADLGNLTVRLDASGTQAPRSLAISPRDACPDFPYSLASGAIFQCAPTDLPITTADVCAISGNRISGTIASSLQVSGGMYRVDVLSDALTYDMAVDKSLCEPEEPEPLFRLAHGTYISAMGSGVIRAGDRLQYEVVLHNDSELEHQIAEWSDFSTLTARFDPIPGGNFLESIAIPEQPICREYEGRSLDWANSFSCSGIYSAPITQAEICAYPGDRVTGVFRMGNVSVGSSTVDWQFDGLSYQPRPYDLALDKSGCGAEG